MTKTNLPVQEIDYAELDALILRVEEAIEHELALDTADLQLLLHAISTLLSLQNHIESQDMTLLKLRKLLGMVQSSEKRPSSSNKKPTNRRKVKQAKQKVVHKTEQHTFSDLNKGDLCQSCQMGKLYKFSPASLLRITGQMPFTTTQHVCDRLRCNACGELHTAQLPDAVLKDGTADQKYGYSARTLMALNKFFSGMPYYHQENLSNLMGMSISASTIFDQCEAVSTAVMPVWYTLRKLASNAPRFMIDDTHHRILTQQPEQRPNRHGKGSRLRTGIYSSGLIALTESNQEIVLFNTSLGHAGEFIDDILNYRRSKLPPPLIMSDALSSNHTTQRECTLSLCNAHARRLFVDAEAYEPELVGAILKKYGSIWSNDHQAKDQALSPHARLALHKKSSLPIMLDLKDDCETYLGRDDSEHHGSLSKAMKYFLKHYDGLSQFCKIEAALIDNNRMEETLKIIIRGRKTAHFFKTVNGAAVANVLTSVIATAYRMDINVYDYLTALQQNHQQVKLTPEDWMPWNYLVNLVTKPDI